MTRKQIVKVCKEPQAARSRSGLAYSVATHSGLLGRLEVGTDVSPGAEMLEAGAGIEVLSTSQNQISPIHLYARKPTTRNTATTHFPKPYTHL